MNKRSIFIFKISIFLVLVAFCTTNGFGQNQDSIISNIPEIKISTSRIEGSQQRSPYAIKQINLVQLRSLSQNNSLQELLNNQVGIFNQNANNLAQDLRISIRGFGARSAFGIRGIKLIVDGIPETTPDGQGQLDNLNLNAIQTIEVLRGPASGLYGNASGGIINISSFAKLDSNTFNIKTAYGSFQTKKLDLYSGLTFKKSNLHINYSHFDKTGFRSHAESRTNILSAKWTHYLNPKTTINFITNFTNSPLANDPGGVNLEDATLAPESARQRNVDFDSGESIKHFKAAGSLKTNLKNSIFKSQVFYHKRDFSGKLPFENGGAIDLERQFSGTSSQLQFDQNLGSGQLTSLIGYDLHFQNDFRQRFINDQGDISDRTLAQNEIFNNLACFLNEQFTLDQKFNINLDLRYDFNRIKLEDRFLTDGDDSSTINYQAFNYSFGIGLLTTKSIYPFIRIASSFETPTLSELSAKPDGGGFNLDLLPIASTNYELGIRSNQNKKLSIESNLFYIKSSNEILPFELETFPDRDFFRNAGSTKRIGLELSINHKPTNKISSGLQYNYAHYTFSDFIKNGVDLKGKKLPGIPKHMLSLNLNAQLPYHIQFYGLGQLTGHMFANDSNEVQIDAYNRIDLKLSKSFLFDQFNINLFGGINNALNSTYFDNIRLNAFGSRYYEAAEPRNYYLGLSLGF